MANSDATKRTETLVRMIESPDAVMCLGGGSLLGRSEWNGRAK